MSFEPVKGKQIQCIEMSIKIRIIKDVQSEPIIMIIFKNVFNLII